jgi:O-antigen/teichoic acid export membrane protein
LPTDAISGTEPPRAPASGEHERHLAISTLAQQAAQFVSVLTTFVAITVLAHRLTLSEFGTFGLLISLITYVIFIQGNVETAAIKAIAEATSQSARETAFSTAVTLYAIAGLVAGALIAGPGILALELFNIPSGLDHQARLGVYALSALTVLGWPLKVFQDVLRGSLRFVLSASAEIVAYLVVGALLVALGLARAQLWLIVAAGASLPLTVGAVSACIVLAKKLPYRFKWSAVTSRSVRSFLSMTSYLTVGGITSLAIYSVDRAILAAFRSPATVGLYEGPIRVHNLVQQVHSTIVIPVLPASARYLAEGDVHRTRELILRGTRYTLAVVVPFAIAFMVLAGPILEVWLGSKFAPAATALTLLVGYWLLNGSTGVPSTMLVAAGRIRAYTIYSAAVAGLNLALSLALTPSLGLNGVALGTTISYVVGFPFFMAIVLRTFPVRLSEFAREVWLPAYVTGSVVAATLVAVRFAVRLDTVPEVVGAAVAAVAAYWAIYYVVWLKTSERLLVRDVALAILRR